MSKEIRSNVIFEDCRIIFKNFAGIERPPYNAAGMRNFSVVIEDEDFARQLADDGWNVKFNEPDEDGISYPPHLQVKLTYTSRSGKPVTPPRIMMEQAGTKVYLTEETVGQLDNMEIVNVKAIEIRPYNWQLQNGTSGVTAYLDKMRVEVARDIFCD